MTVSTSTTQTRRTDATKGATQKRELLNNFSKNVKDIETSTQRTMKFGDNWAKRESRTTYEIDGYLTREQEFALRMENELRESLSVYAALHAFDGVMSAQTYNQIIKEFKESFESMMKHLKVKGYVLTLYRNGEFIGTKLFDDPVRMKLWFDKHLGCPYTEFMNPMSVPKEYMGSILAEQDWCSNPDEFFNKIQAQR
jgi:hypothetical protein